MTRGTDGISWLISDGDQPVGGALDLLRARRNELASFVPADTAAIGTRIARLFIRFPAMSKATPEQVSAYVMDLKRFPLWAIDKGIGTIISGSAMKATEFPPTSLDVQKAVRVAYEPVVDEHAAICAVLNATVMAAPSGEERKRVHDMMVGLSAEIVDNNGVDAAISRKRDTRLASKFDAAKDAAANIDHSQPIHATEALKAVLKGREAGL